MDYCFWAKSHYWTTRYPGGNSEKARTRIKIAYLAQTDCFAFVFSRFPEESAAIEVFRSLEKGEMWFYQEPVNRFTSFSAWCIAGRQFEGVLDQLRSLDDIELEFVAPQTKEGLIIPGPFQDRGLEFFEVKRNAEGKKSKNLGL